MVMYISQFRSLEKYLMLTDGGNENFVREKDGDKRTDGQDAGERGIKKRQSEENNQKWEKRRKYERGTQQDIND